MGLTYTLVSTCVCLLIKKKNEKGSMLSLSVSMVINPGEFILIALIISSLCLLLSSVYTSKKCYTSYTHL